MTIENTLNREIDLFLENEFNENYLIVYVDEDVTDVDDIDWDEIIYAPIIDDVNLTNDKLFIRFNSLFLKNHRAEVKAEWEQERLDCEREYWNSRF